MPLLLSCGKDDRERSSNGWRNPARVHDRKAVPALWIFKEGRLVVTDYLCDEAEHF